MNALKELAKIKEKISPQLAAEIQQRLTSFEKASQPAVVSKKNDLVLVRRPGLPPRPLNSTYFVCHTPS